MRRMNWVSAAALALALAGCASAPTTDVYTYRTDLGPGIDLIVDNELDSGETPTELIWLNASRVREGAWDSKYFLEVRYEGAGNMGYADIGPGESLVLTVDGETLKFKGMGSLNTRKTTPAGTYVESAIYGATPDDLRRIAKAKEVKVDVIGRARIVHRTFKGENIEKFRTFVLTYMGF